MDTGPHIEAIRADLEAVAGPDEAMAAVVERMSRAIEPSLQLRLLDAVGQAALEVSDQLPAGRIDVRLAGRDVQLVYVAEETSSPPPSDDEGETARLTLRMPEALKIRVEEVATREGVSTNSWLVRAVKRGIDEQHRTRRRVGNRLTGFAQS